MQPAISTADRSAAPYLRIRGRIERSGRHLLALITDILDVAKAGAGELRLNLSEVGVAQLCKESLEFVKPLAGDKGLQLTCAANGAVRCIRADDRRLKQILVNLLSNAVKFTPEGGEVTLVVEGEAVTGMAHFSVRDTGIGIPEERMSDLFQPFFQVDSRLARRYDGTGLGLALVKQMAELHGGRVSVSSVAGEGSCFTVSLPWSTPA